MSKKSKPILPVSARPDFVALPSDPNVPLTPEQTAALWGGDIEDALRMIIHGAMHDEAFLERYAKEHPESSEVITAWLKALRRQQGRA